MIFPSIQRRRSGGRARSGRVRPSLEPLEGRALLAGLTIADENRLPVKEPSNWDISGAGDSTIQGFATDISVNQGQTVSFKINDTSGAPYRLDIYRMGYYGGIGALLKATIPSSQTQHPKQPNPITDPTGLYDAGNWAVTAQWAVPADATSGIYFAKVVREDTGGASHIFFVVRNDTDHSQILYQTSDTTWEAYNDYGGKSLYDYQSSNGQRAFKVSYNRPFNTRADSAADFVFNAEYPMVRWLEANGYDVSYSTDVDSDRNGARIKDHKVFMSSGHDEYWSGGQRANVEAARDAGTNLAFFSGNEIFWKTRWESSIDGSGTPYRTLVCYKETQANAVIDPMDPPTWTGTWRDPRFSPPADGGRPENALSGTIFMVNDGGPATAAIQVPAADGKMRFWRNTAVAALGPGQTATLTGGTLGYEWDEDLDNGSRPAGLIDLSTATYAGVPVLQDYGSNYASGTATHHLTLYRRASSGALVFGAGTVQWSWGLDGNHDRGTTTPNLSMQQATVNLLADMNVQPGTLQTGLVATTASTDTTPPTSTITSPAAGTTVPSGTPVTITGTAADTGGGVVGGVEVSVDGGTTWHPATGRGSWS
jgi:N,N-dimethylformamidase beta subunit-like, C-terminal/Bacterial Ig domain